MKIFYKEDYNLNLRHWFVFGLSVAVCGLLSVLILRDSEQIAFTIIFAVLLALAAMVDWKHGKIPDFVNLLILAFGLVMVIRIAPNNWSHHLIGGMAGYSGIRMIEIVFRGLKKQDGIGQGDARMLGAVGFWVTWFGLPVVLLIASVLGIIGTLILAGKRGKLTYRLAFAPAIALGGWSVWFYTLSEQLF